MKSKTVEVLGGLGNQMFQYAFHRGLAFRFPDQKHMLNVARYREVCDNRGYELEEIFGISAEIDHSLFHTREEGLRFRLFRRMGIPYRGVYRERSFRYDAGVWNVNPNQIMYRGFWQNELYFSTYRKQILEDYSFPDSLEIAEFVSKISKQNSVAVHIRKGDYVKNPRYNAVLGQVCGPHYYSNALRKMKEFVGSPRFYLFTDDIIWVNENREIFDAVDYEIVQVGRRTTWEHMAMMSVCAHQIIANSTYSWWAAWLGRQDRCIIAPSSWASKSSNLSESEIVPIRWLKVSSE